MIFGDYRLDAATRQLFRRQGEVHVSPKAFDLLIVLIENRARAVSKAELHERLWPSTFVTEANLASLVAELRRALCDRSETPKFVRTVHRFGYAFCGEISDEASTPPAAYSCWVVWHGREIPMRDRENIIGRDPSAAIRLDFPSVSRRHARIVLSPIAATLEDLGSKNGTFLRNERLTGPAALADRDDLQVGSVKMTVRLMRGYETTETIEQ